MAGVCWCGCGHEWEMRPEDEGDATICPRCQRRVHFDPAFDPPGEPATDEEIPR